MTPQELFDARDRGERIEVLWSNDIGWNTWTGGSWHATSQYRIVKPEPKLVPHWPAVIQPQNTPPWITTALYASVEAAKLKWPSCNRLATEYPPIMLEVKE